MRVNCYRLEPKDIGRTNQGRRYMMLVSNPGDKYNLPDSISYEQALRWAQAFGYAAVCIDDCWLVSDESQNTMNHVNFALRMHSQGKTGYIININ